MTEPIVQTSQNSTIVELAESEEGLVIVISTLTPMHLSVCDGRMRIETSVAAGYDLVNTLMPIMEVVEDHEVDRILSTPDA